MINNPLPLVPADTRIDIRRAVAEGIQDYKEKNSMTCLYVVIYVLNLTILITTLVFCGNIWQDVAAIRNKVAA